MEHIRVSPNEMGIPASVPLPKRKDWRIGIVGFGSIVQGAHAPAYRDVGWSIVAVADPDPNAQKEAREKFGVQRIYADYQKLIADDEVEVIDLCTQPVVREEVVMAAADAGKHIITEKPFGVTIEECVRMVEAADRANIKLAVHQNYRWMKMNYLAHHIIKRGYIGSPFFLSIEIFGRQDVTLARHPFYSQCNNFLTVQWDNHLADLLRYWAGRDAVHVFARTGRMKGQNFRSDNLLVVVTDFGAGLTGHILHSELLRSSLGAVQCRVDGDKGSLVFDFDSTLVLESSVLGKGAHTIEASDLNFVSSHCGSMADVLIAIEEDREPLVSGRRNLSTIRTILAEDESARSGGRWVSCSGISMLRLLEEG